MPDPGAEARLALLEERWRRDPGSRIFLQLSEELRRSGRLTRAIEVLREGLVLQPHYPSALVALGRNLLESGESGEAADVLEKALAQDPTQLVATKLAVEAHLQNGSPAEARARLDLYRLFNDRDDEIVDLDRRLQELERGGRAGVVTDVAAGERSTPPTGSAVGEVEDAPFDWSPALSTAELSFEPEPRRRTPRDDRPFGVLATSGAERRFAVACHREGIFPVALVATAIVEAPTIEAVATAVEVRPAPLPPALEVPEPVAPSEPIEESPAPESLRETVTAEPSRPAESPLEEPADPPWGRRSRMEELEREETAFTAPPFSPREIGAEVERETIEEPFDEVFAASPAPPRLPDVVAGPPASATLGRLYLEQGHLEEAERTFRAVLEQRPDDAVAARGLEETVRRRAAPAEIDEDTASGWSDAAATRPLGSLTQRKVETLKSYLRKIRRSVRPDVS